MADHVRAFDLQNTHYVIKYRRQTIERQVFGERFGRTETRQIERDDSKIWGQSGDDIAPIAMRLVAKSVNQQHGFAGRTAGFTNPQRTTADELYAPASATAMTVQSSPPRMFPLSRIFDCFCLPCPCGGRPVRVGLNLLPGGSEKCAVVLLQLLRGLFRDADHIQRFTQPDAGDIGAEKHHRIKEWQRDFPAADGKE